MRRDEVGVGTAGVLRVEAQYWRWRLVMTEQGMELVSMGVLEMVGTGGLVSPRTLVKGVKILEA